MTRSSLIPTLVERPAARPAESQWIKTIAPEIGVPDESLTVPLNGVSPKPTVGAISESTRSATILIRPPVFGLYTSRAKNRVIRFWKRRPTPRHVRSWLARNSSACSESPYRYRCRMLKFSPVHFGQLVKVFEADRFDWLVNKAIYDFHEVLSHQAVGDSDLRCCARAHHQEHLQFLR